MIKLGLRFNLQNSKLRASRCSLARLTKMNNLNKFNGIQTFHSSKILSSSLISLNQKRPTPASIRHRPLRHNLYFLQAREFNNGLSKGLFKACLICMGKKSFFLLCLIIATIISLGFESDGFVMIPLQGFFTYCILTK